MIAWRRASKRNLKKNFVLPTGVGLATIGVFLAIGVRQFLPILTFGISAFVMTTIVVEFWKGTRARKRIEGEGWALSFLHLVARNRRRWGGYIVHVGIVLIFTAFAASSFDVELQQHIEPGDTMEITSPFGHTYTLTYQSLSTPQRAGNMLWQAVALVEVEKDGEPAGFLTTEKRRYVAQESPVTEVGIRSTPYEDLYLILAAVDDLGGSLGNAPTSEGITLEAQVNPLVSWIWYGALVFTLGSLIGLWPSGEGLPGAPGAGKKERGSPARDEEEREPALVGAD